MPHAPGPPAAPVATLIFADGRSERVAVRPGDTVYAAAQRAGILLEHDCLEGACGTCRALCTAGRFELLDHAEEALGRDERSAGWSLLCRAVDPEGAVFELGYDSARALRRRPLVRRGATLLASAPLGAQVLRVAVRLEGGAAFDYLPGQYVHLDLPGRGVSRSYSMAGLPAGGDTLEFYLKLIPGGAMSEWARAARPGEPLGVTGPFGQFYLRPPARPLLMIAGGTGLAPMLAMIAALSARAAPDCPPVRLLHGAGDASELFGDCLLYTSPSPRD